MRRITYKFFFISLIIPLLTFAQQKAKVIAIKDGDTVVVLLNDNTQRTLRLAEVDCPETGQPFGKNAKQFTSEKVFGKTIEFVQTDLDRYGRTIAMIYYEDHKYLSEELIKAGLGWWYFRYSDNKILGAFESEAKRKGLGLWSDKKALSPWEWRKMK